MEAPLLWQNLKTLASVDEQILSHTEQIANIQRSIALLNNDHQALLNKQTAHVAIMHTLKKQLHEHEVMVLTISDQLTRKKNQLEYMTKAKEAAVLNDEIERLSLEQSLSDDTVLSLWEKLDIAQIELQQIAAAIQTNALYVLNQTEILQDQMRALQKEIATDQITRKTVAQTITDSLLKQYETMRTRTKHPVVPVVNNACSYCYYTLPSQDIITIKQHGIHPCKSCYHLLYLDQVEEPINHEKK